MGNITMLLIKSHPFILPIKTGQALKVTIHPKRGGRG